MYSPSAVQFCTRYEHLKCKIHKKTWIYVLYAVMCALQSKICYEEVVLMQQGSYTP